MRVHLIKQRTVEEYVKGHSTGRPAFKAWINMLKAADWSKPLDIVETFNSADILGNSSNRVVFDIGGNNYRVICSYYFGTEQVHLFVKWIGTHAQYDKICKRGEQYSISTY